MKPCMMLILLCLLLVSCSSQRASVRIGVQPTVGQAITAQILKQLIQDRTTLRPTLMPCGDTYTCLQALSQNRLDLFVSNHGAVGESAPATMRRLPKQLGLTRLEPFGFEGGYLVVMPTDRAAALGIQRIADLTKLDRGVRLAVPGDYLRQARIGPYDLLRRYGLRLQGDLQIMSELEKRLTALLTGKVDVSVVRRHDEFIHDLPLAVLEDSLQFFPASTSAVIVRTPFLQAHPEFEETLNPLREHLDQQAIQQLSADVQIEGWAPQIVADRFLRKAQLVSDSSTTVIRQPEIRIAVNRQDDFGVFEPLAIRAVREVFRGQPARLVPTLTVIQDVVYGRARFALLGAERFIHGLGAGGAGIREERVEVVGVVGKRVLHLVRRENEPPETPALSGRLGLPPRESGGVTVLVELLASIEGEASSFESVNQLLDQVVAGELDAALFFQAQGVNDITTRIADDGLAVRSLPPMQVSFPPFVRRVRIPKGTYAGQTEPVDTIGMQVVIAGPTPQVGRASQAGGPIGVLPSLSPPITIAQAQKLAGFFSPAEAPDPSLPSIWFRELKHASFRGNAQAGRAVVDTVLSIFAALFLVWTGYLVVRRDSR